MSTQGLAVQSAGAGSAPAGASPLPDINAETYPYEDVQRLLDQVAYFNTFATPDLEYARKNSLIADDPSGASGSHGKTGLVIGVTLHPFNAVSDAVADGLKVIHKIGAPAGLYRSRWMFAPPGYRWRVGARPPATSFDPTRPQEFVMLGDRVTFGKKERHGFFGYGTGRTFAETVDGQAQIWVGAIGNITQGFGKFEGLEGVYVFNGMLTQELGYRGNFTCRVVNRDGSLRSQGPLSELARSEERPDATYVVMSGRKPATRPKTEFGPPPATRPGWVSIVTKAQLSAAQSRFTDQGAGGLRTEVIPGGTLGNLDATISLDLAAPPGTPEAPSPFITHNFYRFIDGQGREVGTVTADIELGTAFQLKFPEAPGQQGLRYGGIGRIIEATGAFAGVRGMLSVNSAISIAPHVLSVMQILRFANLPGELERSFRSGDVRAAEPQARFPDPGAHGGARVATATAATIREHDLVLRTGERMHYRESGSPDRPVILMLHGNPAYSIAWNPVLERLAGIGHCIAPDLMGFGDSEKTRIIPSYFNHAEYLDQFVSGLGLRDITLFIQDWGGALGFDHAVRHQSNIRAIAFFESILKPYDSWEEFPQKLDPEKLKQGDPQQSKSALARQKFQDFRKGDIGDPGWEEITVGNMFIKVFMGPLLGHPFDPRQIPEPENDPVLGPLLAPYFRPFPTIWSRNPIWRLSREIPIGGSPPDTVATVAHYSRVLSQWAVPKLLIYSDKGPTIKDEHAQWVRQNWGTNLTVCNLDQLGLKVTEGTHFLQQAHPDEVTRCFRDWFLKLR